MTKASALGEAVRVEFDAAVDQALAMIAARLAESYGFQALTLVKQMPASANGGA
jgi:hypothetical protein